MATALDLISSSLRLINVVASGEETPIDMANDSLIVLNDMIDSWNIDRLAIFTTRSNDFPFVHGKQSYTLGTGGEFNLARPAQIDSMSTILLTNPGNPVEIPLAMYTVEDWQMKLPVKTVQGSIPSICYDDGGFPFRTLSFWPIPIGPLASVRIYSWQPLSAQSLSGQVLVPPGYRQAFRFNLAVYLGAEFGANIPSVVSEKAVESLARIRTMNAPELKIQSDLVPLRGGYNAKADLFGIGL